MALVIQNDDAFILNASAFALPFHHTKASYRALITSLAVFLYPNINILGFVFIVFSLNGQFILTNHRLLGSSSSTHAFCSFSLPAELICILMDRPICRSSAISLLFEKLAQATNLRC